MSLGKLLAAGRSLVGGPRDAGRYNLSRSNQLPKLRMEKNPFLAPAQPQPAAALSPAPATPVRQTAAVENPFSTVANAPAAPASTVMQPSSVEAYKKTRLIPELARLKPGQGIGQMRTSTLVSMQKLALKMRAWAGTLQGLLRRVPKLIGRAPAVLRRSKPVSPLPRLGKPAVQAELSLENLKVMRSDLEESDLEVVAAETATRTQVAPTTPPPSPKRGPFPPALKKLTRRLVGAKALD